jgi:glutamate-5-semialdehyde dehydrogenase
VAELSARGVRSVLITGDTKGAGERIGAELGISTQKLPARGPFALEKLVCEKWLVYGQGQTR